MYEILTSGKFRLVTGSRKWVGGSCCCSGRGLVTRFQAHRNIFFQSSSLPTSFACFEYFHHFISSACFGILHWELVFASGFFLSNASWSPQEILQSSFETTWNQALFYNSQIVKSSGELYNHSLTSVFQGITPWWRTTSGSGMASSSAQRLSSSRWPLSIFSMNLPGTGHARSHRRLPGVHCCTWIHRYPDQRSFWCGFQLWRDGQGKRRARVEEDRTRHPRPRGDCLLPHSCHFPTLGLSLGPPPSSSCFRRSARCRRARRSRWRSVYFHAEEGSSPGGAHSVSIGRN